MATVTDIEHVAVRTRDGQPAERLRLDRIPAPPRPDRKEPPREERRVVAMFCFEPPDTAVGRFVSKTAHALARRQVQVHLFCSLPFAANHPDVHVHPVGTCDEGDLIGKVHEFTRRACNSYLRKFQGSTAPVTLMGHEWSTIPALSLLHGIKNAGTVLSLHSLERQRGGLDTGISRWIDETEMAGIRQSKSVIVHDGATAAVVRECIPDRAQQIIDACPEIPMAGFKFDQDPGEVKARFDVGPVDPTILYIGDLSEYYGANLLMKAMPSMLRSNGQARCIFVGNGDLLWPLRVYSRYLLLDHAVRLCGHLADRALYELIHSADVIAVPSIDSTPWWPIEAAWMASRPVVATACAAPLLLEHEHDCIIVEPNEFDLAAGIQRVLSDPELGQKTARRGQAKLKAHYSENTVVTQIEKVIEAGVSV